jgi:uncharacterized repeat protein (TIGR01451 family)
VANNGPSWARGARVLDPLPVGLSNAVWTCSGAAGTGAACAVPSGTGTIDESVTLPPAGQVTFRLTADVDPGFSGTLANTARVLLPSTVIDLTPLDNEATDTAAIGVTADLAITKRLIGNASSTGSPAVYEIVVTNNGPSAVSGASLIDRLPAVATSAAWTCAGRNGGSCVTSAGIASTTQGSLVARAMVGLPVGASAVMGVTMTFVETTSALVNEAEVTLPSGAVDPITTNNTAIHRATGAITPAIVPVVPTDPTTLTPGPSSVAPSLSPSSTVAEAAPSPAVSDAVNPRTASTLAPPPPVGTPRANAPGINAPAVAAEGADRELALTGADVGRLVLISLTLDLAGWGLVMVARRRSVRR